MTAPELIEDLQRALVFWERDGATAPVLIELNGRFYTLGEILIDVNRRAFVIRLGGPLAPGAPGPDAQGDTDERNH